MNCGYVKTTWFPLSYIIIVIIIYSFTIVLIIVVILVIILILIVIYIYTCTLLLHFMFFSLVFPSLPLEFNGRRDIFPARPSRWLE
jgi:hypothetical protein